MFRGLVVKSKKQKKKLDFYELYNKRIQLRDQNPNQIQPPQKFSSSSGITPSFNISNLLPQSQPKEDDNRFSKKKDERKQTGKGYLELNPDYNSSVDYGSRRIGVGDGGRSWRSRIQRRMKESKIENSGSFDSSINHQDSRKTTKFAPTSYSRDLSVQSRRKMKKPSEEFSSASYSSLVSGKRKREYSRNEDYDDSFPRKPHKRRSTNSSKKNENSEVSNFDPLFIQAVEAQMRGDQKQFDKLSKKFDGKKEEEGKKDRIFDKDRESRYDYNQGLKQYIVSHRNYSDDPTIGTDEDHDYVTKKSYNQRGYDRKQYSKKKKRRPKVGDMFAKCLNCYTSKVFRMDLVVALGDKSWLGFPHFGQLVEDHVIAVPFDHTLSMADVEKGCLVYQEIMKFQHSVSQMFREQGKRCIFLETVTPIHLEKRMHTCIEIIPIPEKLFPTAKSFFSKAFRESEEISSHKKIIEVRAGGIRKAVPSGLPYFYVGFEWEGGLAIVIDEGKRSFPFQFGKEVIAGILGMDEMEVRKKRSQGIKKENILNFISRYEKYDWTRQLDVK